VEPFIVLQLIYIMKKKDNSIVKNCIRHLLKLTFLYIKMLNAIWLFALLYIYLIIVSIIKRVFLNRNICWGLPFELYFFGMCLRYKFIIFIYLQFKKNVLSLTKSQILFCKAQYDFVITIFLTIGQYKLH